MHLTSYILVAASKASYQPLRPWIIAISESSLVPFCFTPVKTVCKTKPALLFESNPARYELLAVEPLSAVFPIIHNRATLSRAFRLKVELRDSVD
jgi:hypothetical protein